MDAAPTLPAPPLAAPPAPLPRRLWTYTRERFPLHHHAPLVAVFALGVAAYGAQGVPAPGRTAAAALVVLLAFFALRVADEHKDAEIDARYRPERAVPRGLVRLAELRALALAGLAAALALTIPLGGWALGAFGLVVAFGAAMTAEFGARAWLRARPGVYLALHLGILPLLDLYTMTVGADGGPLPAGWPAPLAMAYAGGGVFELGRKVRAAGDEREGVETYSAAWGLPRALGVWAAFVLASLASVWIATRAVVPCAVLAALAVVVLAVAVQAVRRRTPDAVARVEHASGAWLLALYAALAAAMLT